MEAFPASDDRTPTIAEDPALALSQRAKLEILFAVMLGLFLGALDQTIVGPALPTIVTQLSGNDYYVWAVTIYLLTSTITVPFWGKLSDIYGRKPIFMIGIVIFLIGSALSGLSQNMGMLILFRGIQGIGAGSLFPVALAVIGDLFSPAERGKYQGLFGAVFGVAFVAGPLVGGWLTENVGWHWIFYVNIPIGIVALAVIQRLLPVVRTPSATRNFDILGGAIFTVAISFLLIGLTNKQFGEWTDPTVGGFILIGIVGSILFAFAERRAKEPIVPLDLWKSRAYSASMVSVFFAAFAFFGAIVFLPRWFQVVEGFSPTNSGLAALPLVIGLIGSSIISGILVSRTGRYKWLIVGSVLVMGFAVFLMTNLTKDTAVPMVWLWMLIAGLGVGPTFSVPTIVIQNAVPFRELGVATSNLTFFRQIGGSIALAFVGTIFATTFQEDLVPQMATAGVPQQVVAGFQQAVASGAVDFNQLTGVGAAPRFECRSARGAGSADERARSRLALRPSS
jgi:EmrB/QacA subfamily drug resistance transporter